MDLKFSYMKLTKGLEIEGPLVKANWKHCVVLFDLILYLPSTIFS